MLAFSIFTFTFYIDSTCNGNFLSRSALRQGALTIDINNAEISRQQLLFPDITFTCNGSITKWIVGGIADISQFLNKPELQIWRNTEGTSYSKAKFSQLSNNTLHGSIAEYNLNTPLKFQERDILGIYQPPKQSSAFNLVVYFQEFDGPANYVEGNSPSSTVTLSSPDSYHYPLVTVEISTGTINFNFYLT